MISIHVLVVAAHIIPETSQRVLGEFSRAFPSTKILTLKRSCRLLKNDTQTTALKGAYFIVEL